MRLLTYIRPTLTFKVVVGKTDCAPRQDCMTLINESWPSQHSYIIFFPLAMKGGLVCVHGADDQIRTDTLWIFSTTLHRCSRFCCVVARTMSSPYFKKLRWMVYSLYTFTDIIRFSSALSTREFRRISHHSLNRFPLLVLFFL